eukprot:m.41471 g.41471  ORF g.41471 m.41471 type:complete len:585 (+) comp14234_c0_seq1:3-1757(+)
MAPMLWLLCLAWPFATATIDNDYVLIDMAQNDPGDTVVGWQQTKYHDPATLLNYGYTGIVTTGELSPLLLANFSSLGLGDIFFPPGNVSRSWQDEMAAAVAANIARCKAGGVQFYPFVDMIVLPRSVVQHFQSQIVNASGNIEYNAVTRMLIQAQFDEVLAAFPGVDGFVVRTGETYVFDTPYHQGNSPVDTHVVPSLTDQQHIWQQFVSDLRDIVCVKYNRKLFFRAWDSFAGWSGDPNYYLNVTNPITPHPQLYFSVKHTSGDFLRFMTFNRQLSVGMHAQIVEVELQREYEGKMAYPNYITNLVVNGFHDLPSGDAQGLHSVIDTPQIRGIWTWSRGGGWWGPYIHGHELWIDLHVYTLTQWWKYKGVRSETAIFYDFCQLEMKWDTETCDNFRQFALLSAEVVKNGLYCPEGSPSSTCQLFTRDDRLGGMSRVKSHLDLVAQKNLWELSRQYKANATAMCKQMMALAASFPSTNQDLEYIVTSARYGYVLFSIIEAGWNVFLEGYKHDHKLPFNATLLQESIAVYDNFWAQYNALGLGRQNCASLYKPYYFNLPGQQPEPGMGATVDSYRNVTAMTVWNL